MKSIMIAIGLAGGLLLAASAPAATQQAASQKPAERNAKLDPNERICKTDQVVGSRFPKRICHTREQWAQMESDAKQMKREMDAKPMRSCGDPSACGG